MGCRLTENLIRQWRDHHYTMWHRCTAVTTSQNLATSQPEHWFLASYTWCWRAWRGPPPPFWGGGGGQDSFAVSTGVLSCTKSQWSRQRPLALREALFSKSMSSLAFICPSRMVELPPSPVLKWLPTPWCSLRQKLLQKISLETADDRGSGIESHLAPLGWTFSYYRFQRRIRRGRLLMPRLMVQRRLHPPVFADWSEEWLPKSVLPLYVVPVEDYSEQQVIPYVCADWTEGHGVKLHVTNGHAQVSIYWKSMLTKRACEWMSVVPRGHATDQHAD